MKINKLINPLILILMIIPFIGIQGKNKKISSTYNEENLELKEKIQETNYIIHEPIKIQNDSDLESFANGGGTGIKEDPFILENYYITATNYNAIFINGTTKFFILRNCLLNGTDKFNAINIHTAADGTVILLNNTFISYNNPYSVKFCVYIYNTNKITIVNNTCFGSDINGISRGIQLVICSYSIIANNSCYDCHWGIVIDGSDYVEVTDNRFYQNSQGLQILRSNYCTVNRNEIYNNIGRSSLFLLYAYNTIVNENYFYNNTECNIYSQASNNGIIANNTFSDSIQSIELTDSNRTIITGNNITDSILNGIFLSTFFLVGRTFGCFETVIKNNYFINNSNSISLSLSSKDCSIYFNHFINTGPVYDHGIDNIWYNTVTQMGNYWDNYNFSGSYLIKGYAQSNDPYPISERPQINNPDDLTLTMPEKEYSINWLAIDDNPNIYSVYINDAEIISERNWSNNIPIIVIIQILDAGSYNYTIVLIDKDGNSIKDTVFITIRKNQEIHGLLFMTTLFGAIILSEIRIFRRK